MKIQFRKIYLIISILILTCFLASCSRDYLGANTLKKDYRITLTNDLELVFSAKEIGWFGDGTIVSIYEHKDEGTKFFEQFISKTGEIDLGDPLGCPFVDERNIDAETSVFNYIKGLEIPKDYQFDWNNNYSWKKVGGLYMFYFYDLNRIYFIALIL